MSSNIPSKLNFTSIKSYNWCHNYLNCQHHLMNGIYIPVRLPKYSFHSLSHQELKFLFLKNGKKVRGLFSRPPWFSLVAINILISRSFLQIEFFKNKDSISKNIYDNTCNNNNNNNKKNVYFDKLVCALGYLKQNGPQAG